MDSVRRPFLPSWNRAGAQVPESVRSISPPVPTAEALSLETPVRYVVTDASMSTYAAILDAIKTGELAASADLGGPPRDSSETVVA